MNTIFLADSAHQKDVFIVWYCKTLQNWKALVGIYGRNEYFELTYNGNEKELYLDMYSKYTKQTIDLKWDEVYS